MRWIIGILLLVNLLVLLWQGFISPPQTVGGQPLAPPDIGNLRLISERGVGEMPPVESPTALMAKRSAAATAPSSGAGALPRPDVAARIPAPVDALAPGPGDTDAKPPVVAEEEADPARGENVPAEQPIVDKPVRPGKEEQPVAPPAREPARNEPAPASNLLCWDVGNFAERAQAQAAAEELPPGLELLDVVAGELSQVIGYYVLVPAAADRDLARATEAQLQEKGFRDTWRFRSGPLENAISLGLFNRQRNAEQHAARIRGEGFDVVLREKTRPVAVFRLRVRGKETQINRKISTRLGAGIVETVDCP
jgi:hypothetical protein